MSSTIAIEIPREVIHATRMKPMELKQELAIHYGVDDYEEDMTTLKELGRL